MVVDFQLFLQQHGRKFPYNQVRKTRRTFHVKWLVLACTNTSYVTLPSCVVDKKTLNHLIITKQAWPLTTEMDEIIDYMECWGRQQDPVWYSQVVDWVAYICREGIKRDHAGLLYDCIALRVRRMLYLHLGSVTSRTARRLFTRWREYFFREYANGYSEFSVLKAASVLFIEEGFPGSTEEVASTTAT